MSRAVDGQPKDLIASNDNVPSLDYIIRKRKEIIDKMVLEIFQDDTENQIDDPFVDVDRCRVLLTLAGIENYGRDIDKDKLANVIELIYKKMLKVLIEYNKCVSGQDGRNPSAGSNLLESFTSMCSDLSSHGANKQTIVEFVGLIAQEAYLQMRKTNY